jgi:TonB family protein
MRACLYLALIALAAPNVLADDASQLRVYAKPVERSAPRYPAHELRRNQQGWVVLNYVVADDGRVVEPVVEQSSGSRAFEDAAMRTVRNWRYEPARLNGEPVQQCKTKVRIAFTMHGAQDKVSKPFYNRYRKIERTLGDGDVDGASAALDAAFHGEGLSLGEMSWLWAMEARIAGVRGDTGHQLEALRRATAGSSEWLSEDLQTGLLTTRTALELERGELSAALHSYTELASIDSADTAQLEPFIEQIKSLVDSDELFFADAIIGGNPNCESCESQWQYQPLRRAIEFADVEGELDNLELRCEWQRFVDEAREGVTWNIPESWGDCSIVVFGTPGTTFKLFELPEST